MFVLRASERFVPVRALLPPILDSLRLSVRILHTYCHHRAADLYLELRAIQVRNQRTQ